ncbi:MAG TPA: hypothetical protein VMT58_08865, partial [Candidatus Binataceae bacterium]|nr:hypothetical protein [Candidatus Binataceae bacterium]
MASKRRKHTGSRGHRRDRPNAETIAAASNSEPTAPVELGESAALPSVSARLSDWILPLEPLLARVGGGDARVGAALAGTLGVTALVFSRCLANAFVFDDDDMIVINRQIGNWSFIWKSLVNDSWWFRDPNRLPQSAYYRPFQDIWLWLNFHLFGLVPAPWHAAMIGLHLVVVWLAFRIASQLATDKWAGVLAAGLFALMPLHAEPVVWASAIPLPLAAAFEFGAFECYLRWRTESPEPQLKWLVLSLGLFAGALLSHESAIVFPLLVAAHSYLFPLPIPPGAAEFAGDAARSEADLVEDTVAAIRPFVYEAAAYIILRLWVLGVISGPNSDNHMTALDVALTIPGVIVSYVALLFAPWLAGPIYRLNIVHGIGSSGFWPPVIVLAGITGVGIALLRNNPRRSLYLFSSLWILIAIGPSLNLTGLFPQSLIQDRYVYFASFGFCLMAADIAVRFARTSDARAKAVSIGVAAN